MNTRMKGQLLFVHGAGEGAYDEDRKMVESLRDALGSGYETRYPRMPDEDSPTYAAWSDRIASELAELYGEVVLVGHSLGASILLKYVSEERTVIPVAGMFLVAPPYWGVEDWEVDEYVLQENFGSKLPEDLPMFFYHSRDDEWVPFAHLALYAEQVPHARFREFDGRGHQFNDDLSEVAHDIEIVADSRR
jgi:serine hydrolase